MFEFGMNFHGDVLLLKEGAHNLGYNHTFKIPVMSWLFNSQVRRDNLFQRLALGELERGTLSAEHQQTVDNAISLSRELPLTEEEFRIQTTIIGLQGLCSPGKQVYSWFLDRDRLILGATDDGGMTRKTEVVSLDTNANEQFVRDYIKFAYNSRQLQSGGSYVWLGEIVHQLKSAS